MVEQIRAVGLSLGHILEKNLGAVVSILFAFGFIWAQFDGVRDQLRETRQQLLTLTSQYGLDRSAIAADQRDIERLIAEVSYQRERIVAQRLSIQALESRLVGLETLREARAHAE